MNLFAKFGAVIEAALGELAATGVLPKDMDLSCVTVEPPRDAAYGDITTNAAMVLAKPAGLSPRELAGKIADLLAQDADIETADVAGPGFINIRLAATFWPKLAKAAFDLGEDYGLSNIGAGAKISVGYVFANSTGSLNVAHCRTAVLCDALANILKSAGYDVSRDWLPIGRDQSTVMLVKTIRHDLALLNIHHGIVSSENALLAKDGQGDYVHDRVDRGYTQIIFVLSTDHGDCAKFVESSVTAVSTGKPHTEVKLVQSVNLLRGGEPVEIINQASSLVAIRKIVDEVGPDAVRFMMSYRKNETPLNFDFEKVTEQSRDNPVFYVQYAHARICSVLRNAATELGETAISIEKLSGCDFNLLDDSAEISVLRKVGGYPRVLESAAAHHEPHRLTIYLHELASEFHDLWNKGKESPQLRFIVKERMHVTFTRLAFLRVIRYVLGNGLRILGVNPVEEM